jgi:hypothetical protein
MNRPLRAVLILLVPIFGLLALVRAAEKPAAESSRFFETQVRPILQAHCLNCHGAEKKVRGKLRLTSRESLLRGGESGPAISLKKSEDSLLLHAINYRDLKMSPRGKLPQAQIDILTRWVKMGAPWSDRATGTARHAGPLTAVFSSNSQTIESPARTESGCRIIRVDFSNPDDTFSRFILQGKDSIQPRKGKKR